MHRSGTAHSKAHDRQSPDWQEKSRSGDRRSERRANQEIGVPGRASFPANQEIGVPCLANREIGVPGNCPVLKALWPPAKVAYGNRARLRRGDFYD